MLFSFFTLTLIAKVLKIARYSLIKTIDSITSVPIVHLFLLFASCFRDAPKDVSFYSVTAKFTLVMDFMKSFLKLKYTISNATSLSSCCHSQDQRGMSYFGRNHTSFSHKACFFLWFVVLSLIMSSASLPRTYDKLFIISSVISGSILNNWCCIGNIQASDTEADF